MKFKSFTRFIGAGLSPLLGSDLAPVALNTRADNLQFIDHAAGELPVHRLAVAYHYTGAGPAPSVVVDAYLYDFTTHRFYKLASATLVNGVLNSIDLPSPIHVDDGGGAAPETLEVVLVPIAAGGEPDGTYEFGSAFDTAQRSVATVPDNSALATAANQTTTNTHLASIATTKHVVAVAVASYNPPLRWIHNSSATAGLIKFKASAGDTAQPVWLAQGATHSVSDVAQVTEIDAGMTVTGGY